MSDCKTTLTRGEDVRLVTAHDEGRSATAEGTCPHCAAEPFAIAGTGRRIAADDRAYEADGVCVACRQPVGLIRAEVNTLFGLHEDEAVLCHGRARVY